MNKTIVSIAIASLLLGGGVGYVLGSSKNNSIKAPVTVQSDSSTEGHEVVADELKQKSGNSLDAEFLEGMIVHHQQAIDMATVVLERTERPELKQMAQDIIRVQNQEISTMQGWLKAWFGR